MQTVRGTYKRFSSSTERLGLALRYEKLASESQRHAEMASLVSLGQP